MRRINGIWPPSKPMRIELPDRAVWPLTDADRAAGPGGLALAAAAAGFAVSAGFTLAQPLAAVFRARTRFQIM
jgi:hypothetical protein